MLIRTVYGPELAAIYSYLVQTNGPLSRHDIHQAFMPVCDDGPAGSTQHIDDALSFLVASGLAPQAVRLPIPDATSKTAGDVEAYLEALRAEIMKHVDDGKPVIL